MAAWRWIPCTRTIRDSRAPLDFATGRKSRGNRILQIGAAYLGILYDLHNLGDPRGDLLMQNLADMTRSLKATHQDYNVSIGQQGIYYHEGYTVPGCDPVQQGKDFYSDPTTGRFTPYSGP